MDDINTRAKAQFEKEITYKGHPSWEELEPWQRESWRCEVDKDRSLERMISLAKERDTGDKDTPQ